MWVKELRMKPHTINYVSVANLHNKNIRDIMVTLQK